LAQAAYPGGGTGHGVDAHGGEEGAAEGVRIEVGMRRPPQTNDDFDRVVVLDRWGEGLGPELETPVPPEILGPEYTGILAVPLGGRHELKGVVIVEFGEMDDSRVLPMRPQRLPPSWLGGDTDAVPEGAWEGGLTRGESRPLLLTFLAGAGEVPNYTGSLE